MSIRKLPYEIASQIIGYLPVETSMDRLIMRTMFPKLDVRKLLKDRSNPSHLVGEITDNPAGLLEAMLVSNTILIGDVPVEYFLPGYRPRSKEWTFVLCDNYYYGMYFIYWIKSMGFERTDSSMYCDKFVVRHVSVSGRLKFKGVTYSITMIKSDSMYPIDILFDHPCTIDHCCITGFGCISLYSALTKNSIPLVFDTGEISALYGFTRESQVPKFYSHTNETGVYSPMSLQRSESVLRSVLDKDSCVVPFAEIGLFNKKLGEISENYLREMKYILWSMDTLRFNYTRVPSMIECRIRVTGYGLRWNPVCPQRTYLTLERRRYEIENILNFVIRHKGITRTYTENSIHLRTHVCDDNKISPIDVYASPHGFGRTSGRTEGVYGEVEVWQMDSILALLENISARETTPILNSVLK